METSARYVWLHTTLYSDCSILIYLISIEDMERSSSKEEVDSVSVHSRYRRSDIDPNTMLLEHKPKDSQMSIVDHIRNHPNIKVLSNEKIEMLRKYMEDSQKPRGFKQLRMVCKSFIDKCASASLGILIDKAYE